MSKPGRQVVCLDGDGATLMHMGNMATVGMQGNKNFKHIIVNNGAHDSVGAQPTGALKLDLCGIAKACGYVSAKKVVTAEETEAGIAELMAGDGPALLEVVAQTGARKDL